MTAQAETVPISTDYLATLRSRNAATLQPLVEGDITKIFVNSGDRVQAGAPILEIDPRKQEATVNNQEAGLKSKQAVMQQAAIDLDRKKKLYAAGVLAKADLDTAQNTYDAAKADAEALSGGNPRAAGAAALLHGARSGRWRDWRYSCPCGRPRERPDHAYHRG